MRFLSILLLATTSPALAVEIHQEFHSTTPTVQTSLGVIGLAPDEYVARIEIDFDFSYQTTLTGTNATDTELAVDAFVDGTFDFDLPGFTLDEVIADQTKTIVPANDEATLTLATTYAGTRTLLPGDPGFDQYLVTPAILTHDWQLAASSAPGPPDWQQAARFTYDNNVYLSFTILPEPGTLFGVALLTLPLLRRR